VTPPAADRDRLGAGPADNEIIITAHLAISLILKITDRERLEEGASALAMSEAASAFSETDRMATAPAGPAKYVR